MREIRKRDRLLRSRVNEGTEGQSIHFEYRYASGKFDQLRARAAELVERKVDVIVAFGTDATRAARGATSSIPIVMGAVGDPVGSGFVTNLARPGGNVMCVRRPRPPLSSTACTSTA